eukprot:5046840-Alexandrium_andersonii.AAC.1
MVECPTRTSLIPIPRMGSSTPRPRRSSTGSSGTVTQSTSWTGGSSPVRARLTPRLGTRWPGPSSLMGQPS